ncbi:MAG: chalcone isomerase family protein [Thermodesulfobacteriota bacterium]
MFKRILIAMLVFFMMASLASARELQDVELPEKMEIDGKTVVLNGAGVRSVMFMKFYVGGLYLMDAETDEDVVMSADEPMAIRLHLIDDVDQDTMKKACNNGFKSATGGNIEPIQPQIDKFLDCFSDPIKEGDIFDFKYKPGIGTKVYKYDDLRSTIKGLDFKEAMFGIWLCDKPADKGLKKAMLAGDVQVDVAELRAEEEAAAEKAAAEKAAEEKAAEEKAAAEKAAEEKAAEEKAAAEKAAEEKAAEEKAAAEKAAEEKAAEEKAAEEKAAAEKAAEEKATAEKAAGEKEKAADRPDKQAVEGSDIYFGFDDDSLGKDAKTKLDEKIAWMKDNPDASVALEAYCSPSGPKVYNKWLAGERAKSVRSYLTEAGIDADRIETNIYGEENLETDNPDQNRRVQFRVIE